MLGPLMGNRWFDTAGGVGNAVLVAPRGHAFSVMIVFVAVFGFFTAVFAIGTISDLGLAWAPVSFGLIATAGVAGILYYRDDRRLEFDSDGVRLLRGEKTQRNIPWRAVARVRYGTRVVAMARYSSRVVPFLEVRGSQFLQTIDFDSSSYRLPEFQLSAFAEKVAREAQARGIKVELKEVKSGYRR